MLNKDARLVENPFDERIEKKPTRDGFGHGTVEAGTADPNVVVLCADLSESTRAEWFEKEFPDRFIEVGVAEQNLAALAAGFAAVGKVPYIASYAAFSPGRNYEQIRTTIALNHQKVVVCGMHAGVSVGPDGATHQMLEDIGLMRMLPGMTVMVPADAEEARKMVVAARTLSGPSYIRFGRSGTPVFTTRDTPFAVGKALTLWRSDKPKVGLVGVGSMAHVGLTAARALEVAGVGSVVLNLGTVKPIDASALIALARETSRIVVVEEHQAMGGAGSAVVEVLSERAPVPVLRIGLRDEFGQSGEPDELLAHYRLDTASVAHAVKEFIMRK